MILVKNPFQNIVNQSNIVVKFSEEFRDSKMKVVKVNANK